MGRPFLVEFDDMDTGKFFICRSCRTPFARNIHDYRKLMSGSEAVGDFTTKSYLLHISNVRDSGNSRVIRNEHQECYLQEIHCSFCNNEVGLKYRDLGPCPMYEYYSLDFAKILYLISGEDHEPETVDPEVWLDQLPPPDDTTQI